MPIGELSPPSRQAVPCHAAGISASDDRLVPLMKRAAVVVGEGQSLLAHAVDLLADRVDIMEDRRSVLDELHLHLHRNLHLHRRFRQRDLTV